MTEEKETERREGRQERRGVRGGREDVWIKEKDKMNDREGGMEKDRGERKS